MASISEPMRWNKPSEIQWPTHLNNSFASGICVVSRFLQCISVDARPVYKPQRVRLHVPPQRRVVVAHPVLMQACLRLEPFVEADQEAVRGTGSPPSGKREVAVGAGGRVHAAEGQIRCLPHSYPGVIGGKDGPPDMVGTHKVECVILKHRHLHVACPDIFPDQGAGAGGVVAEVLGDPLPRRVVDRMRSSAHFAIGG